MDKKICVVCLSVGKPAMLTAAWVNDELIMAERKNYPERRRAMELELLKDLREKEEKGFIVLVDEENSFITGRVGQRIRLRDEHTTGRPVWLKQCVFIQNWTGKKLSSAHDRSQGSTFCIKVFSILIGIKKARNFTILTGRSWKQNMF